MNAKLMQTILFEIPTNVGLQFHNEVLRFDIRRVTATARSYSKSAVIAHVIYNGNARLLSIGEESIVHLELIENSPFGRRQLVGRPIDVGAKSSFQPPTRSHTCK